jgi:hypothetical protein
VEIMKIKNYVVNYINNNVIRDTPVIVELNNRTCNKLYIIKRNVLTVNRDYCRENVHNLDNINNILEEAIDKISNI